MSEMDDIIREFLVESNEGLDSMDRDLVELEKDPDCGELLANIFRAIHTVKGTSGVLGFPRLESLAHAGESLLSKMRDRKVRLTPDIASALLAMVDVLRAILLEIETTSLEGDRDCSEVIALVNSLSATEAPAATTQVAKVEAVEGRKVGEILMESGVSAEAISEALDEQSEGDPRHIGEILVSRGETQPEVVLDALKKQGDGRSATVSSNIRVDVGLLDKVMNLVGELVLARNQVLQYSAGQKDAGFLSTAQHLNLITTELQEGVMKTRMQPIGNVWNKFPRLVRDLAINCGKRIRIELEGSDTELDKTIIEAIKDPLTHIVRNAADHGIEAPEERLARNKPEEGRLVLRAFHEGGQVNIEINDDGCGIDVARVKQKALDRGVVTAEQLARMSERELINLIFLPGFSTAQKVTNVSGRGVGMDVVKTNVEKIGGTVDVYSVPGQSTTLKIKIPLTLAIIPALVVTSAGERFAIPQISLLELVRLEGEESLRAIERIQGAPVYRLRGNLLPLAFLNKELAISEEGTSREAVNIVVLQADGRQFGLVVDEINDTEEIVVKPLGKHLKGLTSFAGATIMGDGQVALILDVLGIAQKANVVSEARDANQMGSVSTVTEERKSGEQWLVFNAGSESRMAVPLSMVARLEEIKAATVEQAGNRDVVQYRGQIMPLIQVARSLAVGDDEQRDPLQVIVYTQNGQSVGLVVKEILDVVEQDVALKDANKRTGLLGSAVIQKHVTDLVDVPALVASEVGSHSYMAGA